MLFNLIIIPLTFIALIIAGYTDIKTREVPDWLNYGLIFAALGIRTIFSFEQGFFLLLSGILGLAAGYGLAALFYYTHQWGGGDSKLLMGMGAVIGISYPLSSQSLDLLWFFLLVLFLGAFYGLFWMCFLAFKKRQHFILSFKKGLKIHRKLKWITLILSGILLLLAIPYSFLRIVFLFPFLLYLLFLFVHVIEKSSFIKQVLIKDLTLGDWLAEDVSIKGKVVLKKKTLEKKDLMQLKNLHLHDQLDKVMIKEGIPFTPSFLLAYLVLLFGKDFIVGMLNGVFF